MKQIRQKSKKTGLWGRYFLLPVLMFALMLSGCTKEEEPEIDLVTVELPEDSTKLYFMNEERTKVVSENFSLSFGTVDEQVSELLTALEETLWTEDEKALISDRNPIYEYKIDENGLLSLRYSSDYSILPSITEVLRRAALVKTLCQLDKITAVEFYIGTQPLLTSTGKPVGMLTVEDFIDSTGENTEFYQEAKVSVYFANETGDALLPSYLKITYDGTVSTERLILQALLKGPVEEDMQSVIPKGTILNKVTIRDGICYVDFNEKFMEKRKGITEEVAVYAVVNSLTELSNVYKVQFLINGATKKNYGSLDFSSAFERNLEIVEGEQ
jgi:germination protein M